ncbi:cilia- and flagella-associated protein 221 [Silurus asotus]|uniref:Cilia- and flagella-associated protein 221 n=1 Tax=Silurus asotus TaxID=30991 RepID=A0AAD5FL64_SILAS|nr:cilia- and flagella-associated protein 221 [Silurus asotus]
MEVVQQTPNSEKKKTNLPLVQLVEETRRTPKVSHHLLETKIFAKVKSNNVIEVEPSELHFSGFEVGKEYRKVVKIINISTKVIRIHVIPPETKYFQTEHTPMSRLVPGLAHTITVHFRPNEWRYFFDSIRIHCKEEENLLVNVHAYPVIDDLNIPPQIDLSPVPLGQRQVQLGDDLFSEEQKIKILQEQEVAASEYMMNKDMGGEEMDIDQTCRKLSSHRVVHCAEEHPDSTPEFSVYESNQLESRSRVLRLFQQTVRKVILQVRINKRLLLLRELVSSMKKQSGDEENIEEEQQLLDASPEKLLPYMSPVFPSTDQPEETAITKLNVPVEQTEEDLTSTIPLFNLKVPQHYKQMNYQKVAVIDSESSFVPIKQLRKGDQPDRRTDCNRKADSPYHDFNRDGSAAEPGFGFPPEAQYRSSRLRTVDARSCERGCATVLSERKGIPGSFLQGEKRIGRIPVEHRHVFEGKFFPVPLRTSHDLLLYFPPLR